LDKIKGECAYAVCAAFNKKAEFNFRHATSLLPPNGNVWHCKSL